MPNDKILSQTETDAVVEENADSRVYYVLPEQTVYMKDAWAVMEEVLRVYIWGIHIAWNDTEVREEMNTRILDAERPIVKKDAKPLTMLDLLDIDIITENVIADAAEVIMRHVKEDGWPLAKGILVSHMLSSIVCNINKPIGECDDMYSSKPEYFASPHEPKEGELLE